MASATLIDPPLPPPSPSPLDPNFSPPTRPPSALSTTSDASFFELYEDAASAPSTEHLPRRMVFSTMRRHGQQCLLCGRPGKGKGSAGTGAGTGELVVTRVLLQHSHSEPDGHSEDTDPITALKVLGLLPHGYTRDDWTNLMTLCKPHADAYDQGVWRWLPGSALRAEIAHTPVPVDAKTPSVRPGMLAADDQDDQDGDGDVTMTEADAGAAITVDAAENDPEQPAAAGEREREDAASQDTASLSLAVHVESTPAETLVDDGISISGDPDARARNPAISFQPVELPSFDVLVLRPDAMPPFSAHAPALGTSTSSSPSPSTPAAPTPMLWRDWKKLTLNPYVALSAALHILGPLDVRGPNMEAAGLRRECLEIGERWARASMVLGRGAGMSM